MGAMFKSPKPMAAPEVAPPAPRLEDTAVFKASQEEIRLRANSGKASTILTSPLGVTDENEQKKRFLGM